VTWRNGLRLSAGGNADRSVGYSISDFVSLA
jgi:hypothetical protein